MAPAVIPGKALAGGLVVLLGWDPAKDHHLLKGLAGFVKTASRQGSCRGAHFVPFALCGLGLGVVLLLLSFGLTLAHLPCLAQCGGARGSDCPCTVIWVQKDTPLFVH